MSGYTFTIAENADAERVGRYQAALAKLRPCCTRCEKTLTASELKRIGDDTRASVRVCTDRAECLLRSIWKGRSGMDLAGYRALRKRQAEKGTAKRADVREVIAAPVAPIVVTPVPVDTPMPVLDSPGHVSGITTVLAPVPARVAERGSDSLIGAYARMFSGGAS